MYSSGGRGGGSAFPFRSAHQQGGGGKGGKGGKGRNRQKPRRSAPKLYCAKLEIEAALRSKIIGKGGGRVKQIQEVNVIELNAGVS